jgi:hypothetical protein
MEHLFSRIYNVKCVSIGNPLSDVDLQPQPQLESEIRSWLLDRATYTTNNNANIVENEHEKGSDKNDKNNDRNSGKMKEMKGDEDALYEF